MKRIVALPQFIERLLIKICDGQASFLERCIGQVLTSAHEGCRIFSRDIRVLNDKLQSGPLHSETSSSPSLDLWSKIERRIEEEERVALYLGKREVSVEKEESRIPWLKEVMNPGVFGGMAVGLATATVAFVVFSNGYEKPISQQVASSFAAAVPVNIEPQRNTAEGVDFVTFSDNQNKRRLISREAFRSQQQMRALKRMDSRIPFEVDWMRSDGQVSFIQDPRERSTVIWVNRNNSNPNRPKVLEAEPKIIEAVR